MTPIEASPDRWTSHPATIGYGIATALGVAVVLAIGALLGRVVARWWSSRR